jgi:hypothetical protein
MAEVWNFRTRRTYKIYYINFSLLWFCKLGNRLLLIIFRSVYHFQAAGFSIKSDKALSAVTVEHNIKENFSTRGFNICCLVDLVRDKLRPVQESTSPEWIISSGGNDNKDESRCVIREIVFVMRFYYDIMIFTRRGIIKLNIGKGGRSEIPEYHRQLVNVGKGFYDRLG